MGKFNKVSKFIQVSDDWYPCFPNQQVQVSLIKDNPNLFRVCVWGADDFGMEKSFTQSGEAQECFKNLPIPLSVHLLKNMGFLPA